MGELYCDWFWEWRFFSMFYLSIFIWSLFLFLFFYDPTFIAIFKPIVVIFLTSICLFWFSSFLLSRMSLKSYSRPTNARRGLLLTYGVILLIYLPYLLPILESNPMDIFFWTFIVISWVFSYISVLNFEPLNGLQLS